MTKFEKIYDSIGRLSINGDTAYLLHSGKQYFCFGFAKTAKDFWELNKDTFRPRLARGYSFIVEPVLKDQQITVITNYKVPKVEKATVTFKD